MEPCKHALFLSVRGTALDNGDFYGPQATLPFRYETKCRLMVTNGGYYTGVKVVAEGNKKDLKASVRVQNSHGITVFQSMNVGLGETHILYKVKSNDRICCCVWMDACGICAQLESAAKKAAADAQSQFEGERARMEIERIGLEADRLTLEAEIDELKAKLSQYDGQYFLTYDLLRLQIDEVNAKLHESSRTATNLQLELAAVRQENEGFKAEKRQLDTKISELTAAMEKSPETVHELAAVKEKLESVEKEKEVFKQKAEESAAKIAELTDALEQHKKTGEGRAKDAAWPDDRTAFWSMREANFLTDFVLLVDGESIPVHRTVLALKSGFFEQLFRSEPITTEHAIDGIERAIVERMVEFCYSTRLDGLEEDAAHLYAAARRFQVASLIDACTKTLKAGISSQNAADLLVLAARHDDHEFAAFAVEFSDTKGGKLHLLLAESIHALLAEEPDVYEKIWRLLKHGSMGGEPSGQQPLLSDNTPASSELPHELQSLVDDADDRSDCTSSSGWDPVDAK